MLKLIIGGISWRDIRYGSRSVNVYGLVKGMQDLSVFETDFSKRILMEFSGVSKVLSYNNFVRRDGSYLGVADVSLDAKALIIMKYTDRIVDVACCGDDCNKVIAEIADEKDLTVCTTRYFNPFKLCDLKEVLVLNNNRVYTSNFEFTSDYDIVEFYSRRLQPN